MTGAQLKVNLLSLLYWQRKRENPFYSYLIIEISIQTKLSFVVNNCIHRQNICLSSFPKQTFEAWWDYNNSLDSSDNFSHFQYGKVFLDDGCVSVSGI